MNVSLPPFVPTGTGSTPHTDPDAAAEDVLRHYPLLPFWPQLPNRAEAEQMIPQVGLSLPDGRWDGRTLTWSERLSDAALERVGLLPPDRAAGLHALLARLDATPPDARPRVVKGQVAGPLTLASLLRGPNGRPSTGDAERTRWLGAFVGRMGAAQAREFTRRELPSLILFDEPLLGAVDAAAWRDAIAALEAAFAPVRAEGALVGVHCCATPDWTRALKSRPDLVHFDATPGHADAALAHAPALRAHLARGGYLGWGIWPTDDVSPPYDAAAAERSLAAAVRALATAAVGPQQIVTRSIVSGVCGAAGLGVEAAGRMAADLEALSTAVRDRIRS